MSNFIHQLGHTLGLYKRTPAHRRSQHLIDLADRYPTASKEEILDRYRRMRDGAIWKFLLGIPLTSIPLLIFGIGVIDGLLGANRIQVNGYAWLSIVFCAMLLTGAYLMDASDLRKIPPQYRKILDMDS